MASRTLRMSGLVGAALAALAMSPVAASADPVRSPYGTDECRMFETKPGYECRSGQWKPDYSPPREGKSCSFGETAPRLRCSAAGKWEPRASGVPREGQKCTVVGAQKVGVGGLLTCTHGPFGFTWQ
ncbi:hypothetical protein TSST111916_19165 [Tsukamurella strandjordii]|uniref:hypothetical protein n=1 Tax=Tsukamurella TaxID=2060 RepID=UPI001C7D2FFE|nr:hypothetical protein [Tsukamurella sp. TY48]GIZ96700.1 hypothetical protein TTY48_13120 [Tsukamurella sp. TY48]